MIQGQVKGHLVSGAETLHNYLDAVQSEEASSRLWAITQTLSWLVVEPSIPESAWWPWLILFPPYFVRRAPDLIIKSIINTRQAIPGTGDNFYTSQISLEVITHPGNEDLFLCKFYDFLILA